MIALAVIAGVLGYLTVVVFTFGYIVGLGVSSTDPVPVFGGAFWPIFWISRALWYPLRPAIRAVANLGGHLASFGKGVAERNQRRAAAAGDAPIAKPLRAARGAVGCPTIIEGPGEWVAAIVEREGFCKHCREPAALLRAHSGVAYVGHVEPRCEGWMSAVRQAKTAGLGPADMAASNIIPTETLS